MNSNFGTIGFAGMTASMITVAKLQDLAARRVDEEPVRPQSKKKESRQMPTAPVYKEVTRQSFPAPKQDRPVKSDEPFFGSIGTDNRLAEYMSERNNSSKPN
ncbi:MAG TPA: hypothetical protein PLF31_03495 [Candidatus Paceibacterota bacterium]|nr:hypothetical protein [Candidatus Paceibacterota bacterium]